MENFSAIKKNELLLHATTLMNIKIITPNEAEPKKKKNAYYEFIYIKVPYSDKNANFCSDRNQVSSFLCSILEGAN